MYNEDEDNYPTLMDELHEHALTYDALRALTAALDEVQSKYDELILNVISKHASETRHQTALRYIREGGGI
jgi:AICAR transformylase/IMP cyclohydrolase PurH